MIVQQLLKPLPHTEASSILTRELEEMSASNVNILKVATYISYNI